MTMPYIVVLWAVLAASPSFAQDGMEDWTAYTSMRFVNQLEVVDREVWAATAGGVLRYNILLRRYDRYTRLDGLAGNQVLSVARDDDGDMWFGTDRMGLSRYLVGEKRFDRPFLDFQGLRINDLLPVEDRIYVATSAGISVFLRDKEEVKETYRLLGALPKDTEVIALALFDGYLWAATSEGISWADLLLPNLQDPASWHSDFRPSSVRELQVHEDEIFASANGRVWVFDPSRGRFELDYKDGDPLSLGIYRGQLLATRYNGGSVVRLGRNQWKGKSTQGFKFVRAMDDQFTAIWAGTDNGLRVLGNRQPPSLREPASNQFYDVAIHHTLEDTTVWVASVPNDNRSYDQRGAYQLDGVDWTVHDYNTGLHSNVVVALEEDTAGRLWLGSWNRGVAVLDVDNTWLFVDETNSVLRGIGGKGDFVVVSDITRDAYGRMWLVNNPLGLVVMDGFPATREIHYEVAHLTTGPLSDLHKLFIDDNGLKWLTSRLDGVLIFDDGGTPFEPNDDKSVLLNSFSAPDLTSQRVQDLVVDSTGRVWIGTDNGLNAVRGFYDRGTGEFEVEDWSIYTQAEGLPSNQIQSLELGPEGNLWVGTDDGLAQINSAGEVAFVLTQTNSGLIDNRINSLTFDADREELWIGTFNGLSRLQVTQGGVDEVEPSHMQIFPNPFVLGVSRYLTVAGLPLGTSLRIFALDGRLVRELKGDARRGSVCWDGTNAADFLVSSGLYYFVAESTNGNRIYGKFAVVRKFAVVNQRVRSHESHCNKDGVLQPGH